MRLPLFTAAALLAANLAAHADTLYNYEFSPGAGYSSVYGDSASLSGSFTWDATTNQITTSNIMLSGTDATGSDSGSVNCSDCTTGIYGGSNFAVNLGPQALYIAFGGSLSAGADDSLALNNGAGNMAEYQGGAAFTSVTGEALIAPTPEPSSIALLCTGMLGMAGVVRKRFA